jgi:hypothetical protein
VPYVFLYLNWKIENSIPLTFEPMERSHDRWDVLVKEVCVYIVHESQHNIPVHTVLVWSSTSVLYNRRRLEKDVWLALRKEKKKKKKRECGTIYFINLHQKSLLWIQVTK